MKSYAIFEAKNRLSELVALVQNGEEITLPRHGTPVARLVAVDSVNLPPEGQAHTVQVQMQALNQLGQSISLPLDVQQALQSGRD